MGSNKLVYVLKRFNMTIQQAIELLAEQPSLGDFIAKDDFVLNRKQYEVLRKAAEQMALSKYSSKQSNSNTPLYIGKEIPISKLSFFDNKVTYTYEGIEYTLKLSGISKRLNTKKYDIEGAFLTVRIKLNTQTHELSLNPKVCNFLWDYNKQIIEQESAIKHEAVKKTNSIAIPLEKFIFDDGFIQLYWNGRKCTYWDNRIRASYMNLIKGTLHGKKKHRRLHGIAPQGTVVSTTLLPKSATILFEEYDIYDFLESLYPHRSLPKNPIVGNVNKNIYSTDSCTIERIHFDTNKYTVVFKCGNKILNPFEEHELGCVPVLNIVCNYLKDKIPTDILVEHFGKRVNRIITKFKIQDFISYLLSKKNDHNAAYWGIVQNEEKRTFAQVYSSSKKTSRQSVLRRNGYIDLLSSFQSPDKLLLLSYEVSNNDKEEDVFIFSHYHSQKWIIVMENVRPERATEVFVTTDEMYDKCIFCIFDYFTNYERECKRDTFNKKKIDPSKFHSLDYYTIVHDSISSWLSKLNAISILIPKIEQPFVFSKGLHISKPSSVRGIDEQTIEVSNLHESMKELLYKQKVDEYGEENVGTENRIGNRRIDLVVKKGNLFDFYEIKTYDDPGKCVQEAFGQILMYAKMSYWESIDNLFIVGPKKLEDNDNWLVKSGNYDKSLSVSYICLPTE